MTHYTGCRKHHGLVERGIMAGGLISLLLSGCLAQQAELTQVEKDLRSRITKLDQREKDLQQAIGQKERELQQSITKAKADLDKQVNEARARLSNEISMVREADLPSMQGGLEKTGYQISQLRSRLEDIDHQSRAGLDASTKRLSAMEKAQNDALAAAKTEREAAKADRDRLHEELSKELTKELNKSLDATSKRLDGMTAMVGAMATKLGARLDESERVIRGEEAKVQQQFDAQARQLESQNHSLLEQMAQYKKALDDFKKVLTGLGEKLVQEEQRTNELSARLSGRADTLTAKVETDTKATTAHLQDVNKSVGTVAKALETMGGQVMSRVEEQDRRLDELVRSLAAVDAQVGALTQTLHQFREQTARLASNTAKEDAPVPSPQHETSVSGEQPTAAASQNARVAALEPAQTPLTREAGGSARDAYDRSITSFKQGNLDAALQGFAQFLVHYPSSEFAPNAQYWLGECYYGKGDYPRAIEAFDRVKVAYPTSEKVPAALLKKGFAYLALKDRYRASSVWRQVVDGYPRTPEAGKAMEKLAQLKQIR
ncbi:MAG TPA: tol-pal system protein YbgF [Nitrospiraceae bacterium]|nr:tol-pal system protein YbgF [Nitrospiraceae bacterium]